MPLHWTTFPERVELFGDLISILETLDRDNVQDSFTGSSFQHESESSAYTVEPNPTGYLFLPRAERMPGLDRLLDRLEREGPLELTIAAVRQLRGRVGAATNRNRAAVDAMTIEQVADALEAAERPATPPAPAPAAIKTLGEFLWGVRSVEDAARSMRATSDAMDEAPGSSWYRLQAGLWEADADYKKHAAFPLLEAYVNQRYGELTYSNMLRVRGDVCLARQCGSTDADKLPLDDVVQTIGCPSAPTKAGGGNHPDAFTVEDVRELLKYRRARSAFDAQYNSMLARQGATTSVSDLCRIAQWSAVNAPQPGRLTEDAAVSLPLYHWLAASARSLYQSDLTEDTLLLLVGMVSIQAKRDVADLMAMTVAAFDTLRNTVATAVPQGLLPSPVARDGERGAASQQPANATTPVTAPVGVVGLAADSKADPPPAHPPGSPATAGTQKPKKLKDRQKLMLAEMLAMGAVGNTKKTTRAEVVQRIDKSKTAADFARDFGALRDAKFTNSEVGPEGGVWLTGAGKTKAEELDAENRG